MDASVAGMTVTREKHPFKRLVSLFTFWKTAPEIKRAKALMAAVDQGGIPTIPRRVHAIARDLGLEVRSSEPVEVTLERIRRAISRK